MYLELKRIETLREGELPQVAAPWYAISWLNQAQSGYCRIQGFNDAWETCIREQDPHRYHWNHKAHGFEHLCAKIKQGDWVVVLDKSWPPLAPAYAQVNGQWQLTDHIWGPRLRQRLEHQVQTVQRQQREQETLQSRNQPSSAEVQTVSASGPGSRAASLGPHAGADERKEAKPNESIRPKYTNLSSMDPEFHGEETGKVWGTKVRYLDDAERKQYKLTVKQGRLFDAAGNPFDTSDASSVFAGGRGKAIFVMDEHGSIFASKTQSVGKFHHSSFLSGKPVAGAGELSAKNGYIDTITRRSGHYQPTQEHMSQVVSQLRSGGVNVDAIKIETGF